MWRAIALILIVLAVGYSEAKAEPAVLTIVMKDKSFANGLVSNLKQCKIEADKVDKALPGKIALISCQTASSVSYQAL